jgi:hypothetical protein
VVIQSLQSVRQPLEIPVVVVVVIDDGVDLRVRGVAVSSKIGGKLHLLHCRRLHHLLQGSQRDQEEACQGEGLEDVRQVRANPSEIQEIAEKFRRFRRLRHQHRHHCHRQQVEMVQGDQQEAYQEEGQEGDRGDQASHQVDPNGP